MNRILILGPNGYDKKEFVKKVFGIEEFQSGQVSNEDTGKDIKQSGIIIDDLKIETKYYKAKVEVFIDEPDSNDVQKYIQWIEELSSEEMSELRDEIQLIIILSYPTNGNDNGLHDTFEESISDSIEKLNTLFDNEYCQSHKKSLQWDGEILIFELNDPNLIQEAARCIQCVPWRCLDLIEEEEEEEEKEMEAGEEEGEEEQLVQFEKDLARLRNARETHQIKKGEENGDDSFTTEEKELVNSIMNRLF